MRGLLACAVLVCVAWSSQVRAQADKEKEAIKAVIVRETFSFMNVNRAQWADAWVHAPYAYWSFADSTGSSAVDGWENISKTFDGYFKTEKPSAARITQEWKDIVLYGNGAYARFTQRVEDGIDKEVTSQMRVLEKHDGKWKVVCVGVVAK